MFKSSLSHIIVTPTFLLWRVREIPLTSQSRYIKIDMLSAGMVESVDTRDLKSLESSYLPEAENPLFSTILDLQNRLFFRFTSKFTSDYFKGIFFVFFL